MNDLIEQRHVFVRQAEFQMDHHAARPQHAVAFADDVFQRRCRGFVEQQMRHHEIEMVVRIIGRFGVLLGKMDDTAKRF